MEVNRSSILSDEAIITEPRFYRGVGWSVIDLQVGQNRQERVQKAKHVAMLNAYRDLASQVRGVALSAESLMSNASIDRDRVKLEVQGSVSGAKLLSVLEKEGQIEVVLELWVE